MCALIWFLFGFSFLCYSFPWFILVFILIVLVFILAIICYCAVGNLAIICFCAGRRCLIIIRFFAGRRCLTIYMIFHCIINLICFVEVICYCFKLISHMVNVGRLNLFGLKFRWLFPYRCFRFWMAFYCFVFVGYLFSHQIFNKSISIFLIQVTILCKFSPWLWKVNILYLLLLLKCEINFPHLEYLFISQNSISLRQNSLLIITSCFTLTFTGLYSCVFFVFLWCNTIAIKNWFHVLAI